MESWQHFGSFTQKPLELSQTCKLISNNNKEQKFIETALSYSSDSHFSSIVELNRNANRKELAKYGCKIKKDQKNEEPMFKHLRLQTFQNMSVNSDYEQAVILVTKADTRERFVY